MAEATLDRVSQYIRRLVVKSAYRDLADSQLLQKFLAHRDEAAFAALVHRHGPMVWQVCNNVLHHVEDTEDAFQATFLVLAHDAAKIGKPEALGSWLHGVALRFALRTKRDAARRRTLERKAIAVAGESSDAEISWREVRQVLDEEIQRLPEKFRLPFVLCVLEEHSLAEAARQLGWKEGTVSGRLSLARKRLRDRLARRGIEFSAVLAAVTLGNEAARASLPLGLAARTVRATMACPLQPGSAVGFVSTSWHSFVQGATNAMSLTTTKLKITVLLTLVLTAVASWSLASSRSSAEAESAPFDSADRVPTAAPERQAKQGESYGGTVKDAMTDKAVAGIKVVVQRIMNGKPDGKIELTSDADGHFRVELPAAWASTPEAQLRVDLEAPQGYVAFPYRKEWGDDTEDGVALGALRQQQKLGVPPYFGRVLLFPTKEIRGRLETPDGMPAEDVDVIACSVPLKDKASPASRVVRRTKTDKEGRFTAVVANPGPVVLYFMPERYAARYVKLNDAQGDLGTYKLEQGVEVSGKLRDVRNRPLPGCWVRVGTWAGPGADFDLQSVGLSGFSRWCRTGPGGTFRTAPLPSGEYEATAHGTDVSRDVLMGRERASEPLEFCIVPQKVVVRKDKAPQVVLQAVPHINIEIRVTDRDAKPKGNIRASYRYSFDGKEHWYQLGESPMVGNGSLVVRVPHGTHRFQVFLAAKKAVCRIRNPGNDSSLSGPEIHLRNLEADKTLDFLWMPCTEASLKVTAKDGSPIKDADIEVIHGPPVGYNTRAWEVTEGIYWIHEILSNRPFRIRAKADGYEPVTKEISVKSDSPGPIEITLEKKK